MNRVSTFLSELFRRRVVRLLGAYIAVLWLLSQGFAQLAPVLGIPESYVRVFIIAGVIALPLLALISWKYNFVPPALIRDEKDVDETNPALVWAGRRHDNAEAGHLLLRWTAGEDSHENRFRGPVSIGREPSNEVTLPDQYVSRYHAILWAENGRWHVRDLDSTNGTYIEGKRVKGIAMLPASCELRFHPRGPVVGVHVHKVAETAISTDFLER
jgi:hypothetical protein